MKQGDDPDLARAKRTLDRLPAPLLRLALRVSSFVSYDLDRSVRALGIARASFVGISMGGVTALGLASRHPARRPVGAPDPGE